MDLTINQKIVLKEKKKKRLGGKGVECLQVTSENYNDNQVLYQYSDVASRLREM